MSVSVKSLLEKSRVNPGEQRAQVKSQKGRSDNMASKKAAKKSNKTKPVRGYEQAASSPPGTRVSFFPEKKQPPKRRKKLFRGTVSKKGVSLRALGGGFDMKSVERFIKPALLITGGALGMRILDATFIYDFVNGKITDRYHGPIRLAIALAIGIGVASFSKKDEAKLLALGITASQVIEFVAEFAKANIPNLKLTPKSSAPPLGGMARSVGRMDGVRALPTRGAPGLFNLNGASRVPPAPRRNMDGANFGAASKAGATGGVSVAPAKGAFDREFAV